MGIDSGWPCCCSLVSFIVGIVLHKLGMPLNFLKKLHSVLKYLLREKRVSINDFVLFSLTLNLIRLSHWISGDKLGCLLVYFHFGNSSP